MRPITHGTPFRVSIGGTGQTTFTAGRVPIVASGPVLADTANLLWDDTLERLRIGATDISPAADETSFSVDEDYTTQTQTNLTETIRVNITTQGGGDVSTGRIGISSRVGDNTSVVNKTITGAADNGSGAIRITATGHTFSTGETVNIYDIVGTTEANDDWTITVIDANTFDLDGSTFTNAYTSGGTATNRGLFYGYRAIVKPSLDRGGTTNNGDDVVGYAVQNSGAGKATEAFYVAAGSSWFASFSSDADSDYLLRSTATLATAGIDLSPATMSGPAIKLGAGHDVELDTVTGTKIGTATSEKLGFFNATPIIQPVGTTDLRTALINLGLYASGGASPLDLNGGTLTAANAHVSTFLGVGTTSPAEQIDVFDDAASTTMRISSFSAGGGPIWFARKGRGSEGSPLRTKSGDSLLRFLVRGYHATSDVAAASETGTNQAVFKVAAEEDFVSSGGYGTKMEFSTTPIGSTSGATTKLTISGDGNISGTAGTTGMTDGFFYIPAAAGAPSGTPTAVSGTVPMYYDTTNEAFYIYNGAWVSVTLA